MASVPKSGGFRSGGSFRYDAGCSIVLFMGTILALVLFAFPIPWPNTSFMPDALGYAEAVSEGRWVAHAPGYPLFVAFGRLVHLLVPDPVAAVQWASFALYSASLPLLYFSAKREIEAGDALILSAAYSVSWIPLYFSRSGTNHAADLFCVALMIFSVSAHRFGERGDKNIWTYALGMVLAAGFRLPSFLMLAPFFAAVFFLNRRNPHIWIGYGVAAAAVLGIQAFTIMCFGGWQAFRERSAELASGTDATSVLLTGLSSQSGVNFSRALIWFGMVAAPFLPVWIASLPRASSLFRDPKVVLAMASILGPLAVNALYLSTHPGYLAVAVPGTFWLVALLWKQLKFARWVRLNVIATALFSISCFWGFTIFDPPGSVAQAVANGLFLQYSRDGIERRTWRPTAEWLVISGNRDLIPPTRRQSLDSYLEIRNARQISAP